jgi:hypothetical protein
MTDKDLIRKFDNLDLKLVSGELDENGLEQAKKEALDEYVESCHPTFEESEEEFEARAKGIKDIPNLHINSANTGWSACMIWITKQR